MSEHPESQVRADNEVFLRQRIEELEEANKDWQKLMLRLYHSDAAVYATLTDYFGSNLRGSQHGLHERLSVIVNAQSDRAEKAEAEVERLRELNHQVIQDEIEWREKAASRLEEVERLRALLRDIVEDSEGDGPINRGLNSIQAASNYLHLRGEGEK